MAEDAIVRVSQLFRVPRALVFAAWTDVQTARRWFFSTPGGENVRTEIDARAGGRFVVVERRLGEDVAHFGRYLEFDPPRRLVFELHVPAIDERVTRVNVDLTVADGGCELALTHEGVLRSAVLSTELGWLKMLLALDGVLPRPLRAIT